MHTEWPPQWSSAAGLTAAGFGATGFFELGADGGRVCAAGRNDLVLVVVAESRVNVGLIRVEMLRALELFA